MSEEASGTDKGLMGYAIPSEIKKPSDGVSGKEHLGCVAGQTPRGPSGGGGAGGPAGAAPSGAPAAFMKKRMKKK